MILLLGTLSDPPLAAVARELEALEAPTVLLDVHAPAVDIARPWSTGRDAAVRSPSTTFELDDITAAYLRPVPTPLNTVGGQAALRTVLAWADSADSCVLNPPSAATSNMSKPLQLLALAEHGFLVPETLVTTTAADVRALQARVGEVVYKSVSATRSIVRRFAPDRDVELSRVAACPTQFQEYIPGHDVRVHVIGDEAYALLIDADGDDYRYAGRHGVTVTARPLPLSTELAHRVRATVRDMGLVIAGVDLRRTPNGDWYALEVNPSPGFTFYERISGEPIAPKIAALLATRQSTGSAHDSAAVAAADDAMPSGRTARHPRAQ